MAEVKAVGMAVPGYAVNTSLAITYGLSYGEPTPGGGIDGTYIQFDGNELIHKLHVGVVNGLYDPGSYDVIYTCVADGTNPYELVPEVRNVTGHWFINARSYGDVTVTAAPASSDHDYDVWIDSSSSNELYKAQYFWLKFATNYPILYSYDPNHTIHGSKTEAFYGDWGDEDNWTQILTSADPGNQTYGARTGSTSNTAGTIDVYGASGTGQTVAKGVKLVVTNQENGLSETCLIKIVCSPTQP